MNYFIIAEKGTGKFLPLPRKIGYGFTQVSLTDQEVPRLFSDPKKAAAALREWLKGHQYNEWNYDHYEGPFVKAKPERIKSNMEIVEVEIRTI